MSDLISRQAAISHVDDVPYIKEHPNVGLLWKAWIESLPSAQPEKRTEERAETHACDLIDRQALMKELSDFVRASNNSDFARTPTWNDAVSLIGSMPSAQPELPKQFMSNDCISRSELYKKVCEAEKLAQEMVLDTRSDSPFPNKLNPAYIRYSAQLDERTQFKHMIADARSIQPEIVRCKDCAKREHCRTSTVWAVAPNDDWYCADAERRTDDYQNNR